MSLKAVAARKSWIMNQSVRFHTDTTPQVVLLSLEGLLKGGLCICAADPWDPKMEIRGS
jgi:hypothetical protein